LTNFACDELLVWSGLEIGQFKEEVAECILHPAATDDRVQTKLRAVLLAHPSLGDPRLPANSTKWSGVRSQAQQKFREWLSQEDIKFFFDHAFPKGGNSQGRKRFWLEYVERVTRSRPLLCRDDENRLRSHLRDLGHGAHTFGKIDGSNSAFLLDFGPVCAVEFSRLGGACYLYESRVLRHILPVFYGSEVITQKRLKQRELCLVRVVHKDRWQDGLRDVLASKGVRP